MHTAHKKATPEFRSAVKALKKAGIVDVDVTKAKPWWVRKAGPKGGSYTLSELVTKYDDLISKKQTPVKLPPDEFKKQKARGYEEIRGGRLLVPHSATEKVVVKGGHIKRVGMDGISRVEIPVEYHNLEQYLRDLQAQEKRLQKQRGKNRQFAFRFYSGHSRVYPYIDQLLEEFLEYKSVQAAIDSRSPRQMNEVYRNFEIVTVTKKKWEKSKELSAIARKKQKHRPHERQRILDNLKAGPAWKLQQYHQKRAEQQKRYRASLTGAAKTEYKKDARRRAKKSTKNQKGQ